jgi:hypothetical protein
MKILLDIAPLGIMNLAEIYLSSSEKSIKISSMRETPIPPEKIFLLLHKVLSLQSGTMFYLGYLLRK